jgi:hypothetical protein
MRLHLLIEYLVLAACLLGVVALIQLVAMRLAIPEATALSLFGIAIGASYFAARQILELPRSHRFARWLLRRAALNWPLAAALTQRFELIVCRRAVLSRLQEYNRNRLAPMLGDRVAHALGSVIARRCALADRAIQSMREDFGEFSNALERRLLSLLALRRGAWPC